jgi:hypothetical protein
MNLAQSSQTSPPADHVFHQNQRYSPSFAASFVNQLEQSSAQREENFSSLLNSNPTDFDFSQYPPDNNGGTGTFESSLLLDPQQQSQANNNSINPADLVSRMSSPHLLNPEHHSSPGNSHATPPVSSAQFYSPRHSRHTSLDPVSAAYMTSQSQADWQGVLSNPAFQVHRRTPSEHSDVSSASHSPFMGQQDSFDNVEGNPSPLLSAQTESGLYENALGIESFTLSEQQQQQQQPGLSPAHSPYVSPQILPQGMGDMGNDGFYLSAQQTGNQFPSVSNEMYVGSNDRGGLDMAQMAQMAPPPSINVEFAPPARVPSFGPGSENDFDALSPPSSRKFSDGFGLYNNADSDRQKVHVDGASQIHLADLRIMRTHALPPRTAAWILSPRPHHDLCHHLNPMEAQGAVRAHGTLLRPPSLRVGNLHRPSTAGTTSST